MTNLEFIRQFESDTLAGEFHHVDHVRLAFAYLSEYAPLEALERFSVALKRYAAARGKAQLYHVERNAGGRTRAAARYRIAKKVLDTMGTITTKHGDCQSARKASAAKPLTGPESAWVQAAVKILIWQLGTPETERSWITMADLPPL